VVEELGPALPAKVESVGASAKLSSERSFEIPAGIVHDDRLRPHARAVDGVRHVDGALGVLRETVGLAPDHPVGGQKPVMHALIGVRARAHDRQAGRGLG
jgi:hypothetical protein